MRKLFAIGDIHGEFNLLRALMGAIEKTRESADEVFTVVFLGDYVDRGPHSRQVVEFLMAGPQNADQWICLKGNHEDLMAVEGAGVWMNNGGVQTLHSYSTEYDYRAIPQEHLEWMRNLPTTAETEHHLFVHAGFMPGVPLHEQEEEALIWIRDRFLRAREDFVGWKHIVHGHTPSHAFKKVIEEPEFAGWRTNLDTGAFYTGVLTAGLFDRDKPGSPIGIIKAACPNAEMRAQDRNIVTSAFINKE